MNNRMYRIIFRACDVVNAVNKNPRPFDLDKTTLVKICFLSMYESVKDVPHKIYVLGDKLSENLLHFFSGFDVDLVNGNYGNDESIRRSLELALTFPDEDWVYFCEDDYLHRRQTFSYIDNLIQLHQESMPYKARFHSIASFIELRKKDLVIHPCDYPDRYLGKYRRFSFIFHTNDCHWRQITDTTFTFILQTKSIKKYYKILLKSSYNANDRYLSKHLYARYSFMGKALCVSPMPALSTHMHRDTMSPIIDWESIVTQYRNMIQ